MVAGREEAIQNSIKKLFAMMTETNQKIAFLNGAMVNAGIIKLDAAFDAAKPALDQRTRMVRKMFARAREVQYAEADLKSMIKKMWNLESTKEMTVEMLGVVLNMLDGMASHGKGAKS